MDAPLKTWEELKRISAEEALRQTGGRITPAAELLGIHRDTLRKYWQAWKKADCRRNQQQ